MESFWQSFHLDPRAPEYAAMRASDADRETVRTLLGESYADGRLSREEYDERIETLLSTRTLGELPPLVADLVSPSEGGPPALARSGQADLRRRAAAAYRRDVQEALSGFLVPSLIVVVIWYVTSGGDVFFWPAFVMLFTGINLVQTVVRRESIIEREVAKLEKKQARKLPPPPPPAPEEGPEEGQEER